MENSGDGSGWEDGDVWDLGLGSDQAALQQEELNREWKLRESKFHNLGYRDGIDAGKQSTLQEGFDAGYREAAPPGFNWGVVKGASSAWAALPLLAQISLVEAEDARARLGQLHSAVTAVKAEDALRFYYEDAVLLKELPSDQDKNHNGLDGITYHETAAGKAELSSSRLQILERDIRTHLKDVELVCLEI